MAHRMITTLLAAGGSATALLFGGPATATVPSVPGGLNGPVMTQQSYPPRDYPAGDVCAFPLHIEFPVSSVTQRTWSDDTGRAVFAVASGPLTLKVTNVATGRTVTRSANGTGTYTYPDATSFILSGSEFAAFLHTGDTPANRAYIIGRRDFGSVHVSTVAGRTTRTMLHLSGHPEDLCRPLAH